MTQRNARKATYDYRTQEPRALAKSRRRKIAAILNGVPRAKYQGRKLFGAEFFPMGSAECIVFTERLTDAVAVRFYNEFHDSKVELVMPVGTALLPMGETPIDPKPISDDEWNELARQPCYRNTFSIPPGPARGEELAGSLDGARFDGDRRLGPIFLVSSPGLGCDLFAREAGRGKLRRVLDFPLESASEVD